MAFNEEIKSNRLLQSRRFTQDALTDSQEAFTRVLDLGASEIYTQTDLIPTSSLPFSGSSQDQATYSVEGKNILKYWYRQRLTPSDTYNTGEGTTVNTWFFISGSDFSAVNPGVIATYQQTNFVSPKYAPSLGSANTEGSPAGYLVRLHNQTTNTIIDPATYTFDYKTGIIQFNEQSGLTVSSDIRLTAYQYIGETLENFISDGGGAGFPFSGSAEITGSLLVSGSGGITVIGGPVTLTSSSITSVSSSINFTTGSINITNGSITAPNFIGTASLAQNILPTLFEVPELNLTGSGIIISSSNLGGSTYNALRIGNTELIDAGNIFITNIGGSNGWVFSGSVGNITDLAKNDFRFYERNLEYNFRSNDTNFIVYKSESVSNEATTAFNVNRRTGLLYASGGASISGSANIQNNVTLGGTLTAGTGSFDVVTAQVLEVTYISSSVIYSSGSNIFGDELTDTQTFTGSVYITGSAFTWNGNTVITTADTASMTVLSASYASTASYVENAQTASYVETAQTASYVLNAQTASYVETAQTASYVLNAVSASYVETAQTASYVENAQTASYVQIAQTASYVQTAQTASYVLNAVSASYVETAQTASYVLNAVSASYVLNAISASYVETAQTASYVLNAVSASYVETAQTASYVLNAVSASYVENAQTASYVETAQTASYVLNAVSASYVENAQTASYVETAQTASYVLNAVSASYVLNAVSSSFASTASYVNTLNQDVIINGAITANAGTSSFNNITITNNAIVNGDFFVYGSSSFINVNNLAIEDKFILLNSGSTGDIPNEGGIIVQTTSSEGTAYGTALFYDQETNRWLVAKSSSVAFSNTSITVGATTDYIVTVSASAGAPTGTPINFGTTDHYYGQMYVQTDTSDIYIYA